MKEREQIVDNEQDFEVVNEDTKTEEVYIDPLEALLAVDTENRPTDEVYIKRLNTKVTVQAPDPVIYQKLISRCTEVKRNKKTQAKVREFNSELFQKLVIFEFTTNPDLKNTKLQAKYKCQVPEDIVDKAFYPGERDRIADAILTLGGYTDDLVEEAKN